MPDSPDVPDDVLALLRARCLPLPGAYEERAWTGTRWMVRKKTFAHVLGVSDAYPPAHSRDAPFVGDGVVLTFRAEGDELAALVGTGHPFYKPRWHPQVVGMVVEQDANWDEIGELLIESYCLRAPKNLVARVHRPGPEAAGPG